MRLHGKELSFLLLLFGPKTKKNIEYLFLIRNVLTSVIWNCRRNFKIWKFQLCIPETQYHLRKGSVTKNTISLVAKKISYVIMWKSVPFSLLSGNVRWSARKIWNNTHEVFRDFGKKFLSVAKENGMNRKKRRYAGKEEVLWQNPWRG